MKWNSHVLFISYLATCIHYYSVPRTTLFVVAIIHSLNGVWLFATSWTVARQAPLSMGFPGKILEWVAISFSRGSAQSSNWTLVSGIGRRILYRWATRVAENYFKYFASKNSLNPRSQPIFWLLPLDISYSQETGGTQEQKFPQITTLVRGRNRI